MLSKPGPVRGRMAAKRRKKFEGLDLEHVATVQTKSLRGRTIKIENAPCSSQRSALTNSGIKVDGTPGDNIEEQVKVTAEGLPEDWIKEVKPKRNNSRRNDTFYVDPKSGYAFHSLEDAVRYIQTGSILSCMVIPQKRSREDVLNLMNNSETRSMPSQTMKTQTDTSSSEVKLNSDGLPGDWVKEVKPRIKNSNRKDSFYIDLKTGYAFRSLKDALRYLETGDVLNCATKPQKRSMEEIRNLSSQTIKTEIPASPTQPSNVITDDEKSSGLQCKVVQEHQLNSNGLPTSWIKELKPRNNGSAKMDPFYIDPDTGYAFLSLKDALRYLATGNIRSCIVRPRKRSVEEMQALMISCKMSSISEMKTVQQESLQCVQPHTLNRKRKRKRSPMKMLDVEPKENLKTKGTKTAIRPASRRVKQRKEEPSYVRASPRLMALKAEHKADENHEENNNWCNTMPGISNSSESSDLDKILNSQPDTKSKEEVVASNGNSTGNLLHRGKMCTERRTSLRASFHLASQKVTSDITSIENNNGITSNALLEPSPSLSQLNLRPSGQLKLELEETMEWANGNSTKTRSRGGVVRKERRTPLRASSRLAVQKVINDATLVENKNSAMSNALFGPLPSPSSPNLEPSSQPEAELNNKTIERTNSSSTTSLRRVQMRRERPAPHRGSSRLAEKVTNDATFVENKNSAMSNALFGPLPSPPYPNLEPTSQHEAELDNKTIEGTNSTSTTSLRRVEMHRERPAPRRSSSRLSAVDATSDGTFVENKNIENKKIATSNSLFGPLPPSCPNLRPTSQPEAELNNKTIEGTNSSSTTSLHRVQMGRERPTPCGASSCLAAADATSNGTSVENNNSAMSNAPFGPLPSPSYPNLRPTSQPEAELNYKTIEGANSSSTTSLCTVQMHKERPTPRRASCRLAAVDATSDGTSVENENCVANHAFFNPSPSFSSVNTTSVCQPDLDVKEERIPAANGSLFEVSLQRDKQHRERPVALEASSHQASFKATTYCTARKIEDSNRGNYFLEPPTSRPDLNLESTSSPAMEFEELTTAANGRGSRTIVQKGELIGERPATIKSSFHMSALQYSLGTTSDEKHGNDKRTCNAVSELRLPTAHPDLNFGPANQPYIEDKEDAVNGSAIRTISRRVEPHEELLTSVRASPSLEALRVTTETTSFKINEKNSITTSAWSKSSHFPGRPDLNLGPTNQLTMEHPTENTNASATGSSFWRMNVQGARPTPVVSMSEAPSCYNYESNFKISNYFCEPVESSANQIIMGSTSQPNPVEVRLGTTAPGPSSVIAASKIAPDLNMVPMSWPEPIHGPARPLGANPGPRLEQQQHLAGVNTVGEFHLPPPVHSQMPYQDPTMDALLSGQEVGPSMPHMSIDALNSPVSPFFGDFWHDPCLSYAFRTLTGGPDQRQPNLGLGPENNVSWAGAQIHYPNQNPNPSASASRTQQNFNFGMPFLKR